MSKPVGPTEELSTAPEDMPRRISQEISSSKEVVVSMLETYVKATIEKVKKEAENAPTVLPVVDNPSSFELLLQKAVNLSVEQSPEIFMFEGYACVVPTYSKMPVVRRGEVFYSTAPEALRLSKSDAIVKFHTPVLMEVGKLANGKRVYTVKRKEGANLVVIED